MPDWATTSTTISCTSSTDLFRSALRQQFGSDQGRFVPPLLPDAGNQCMGGRISQLIELTLQRGGCRFGVKTGGGDALVSEKALQIGDVHAEREQAGGRCVAQQMRVDALADAGGDGADDLANPLARQHVRCWPRTFLTA